MSSGLRNGTVLSAVLSADFEHHAFQERLLGLGPVHLVTSDAPDQCFALCDSLCYRAQLTESGLTFHRVFTKGVITACPVGNMLAVATKSSFTMLSLGEQRSHVRSIPLAGTPRRIFYDKSTKLTIVAITQSVSSGNEDRGYMSTLQVVDPSQGVIFTSDAIGTNFSADEDGMNVTKTEAVFAISSWRPKQSKRFIIVGTAVYDDKGNINGGRLLLFNLKKAGGALEPAGVISDTMPGAVLAIASAQEQESLLLAASDRFVYAFSMGSKDRKLTEASCLVLRWTVTSLSCVDNEVAVGCQRDSVSLYRLEHGDNAVRFVHQASDIVTRTISDCIMLQNKVIIAADRHGNLFGLAQRTSAIQDYLEEVFCIYVGSAVMRLQAGGTTRPVEMMDSSTATQEDGYGLRASYPGGLTSPIRSAVTPVAVSDGILECPYPVHAVSVLGDVFELYLISSSVFYPMQALQKQVQKHCLKKLGLDHASYRGPSFHVHNVIDGLFLDTFVEELGSGDEDEGKDVRDGLMSLDLFRFALL